MRNDDDHLNNAVEDIADKAELGLYGGLQWCNYCKVQHYGVEPSFAGRFLACVNEEELWWIDSSLEVLNYDDGLAVSQVG